MAFNIIKYNKVEDDVYIFIQKMPGIYNKKLSLYFAYMYSIFDFRFRYSIFRNIDVQTKLKSRNYEI